VVQFIPAKQGKLIWAKVTAAGAKVSIEAITTLATCFAVFEILSVFNVVTPFQGLASEKLCVSSKVGQFRGRPANICR
jgi:hypothetical protein